MTQTRFVFRPIEQWPGDLTKQRRPTPFSAKYPDTIILLGYELDQLGAAEAVIQLALTDADLRRDGLPRAGAKPDHPGVIVSFESAHKGPLRFATDEFEARWSGQGESWHANLRAVALGLEALRKVDRYGITRGGEQYRGWQALPPGTPMGPAAKMTVEDAARVFAAALGVEDEALIVQGWERDGAAYYRDAAKRLHPDHGGTAEAFRLLTEARDALDSHL